MAIAAVLGGFLAGIAYFYVAQAFDAVFLLPLIMGMIGGIAVNRTVPRAHCRSAAAYIACAILGAIVLQTTQFTLNVVEFRSELLQREPNPSPEMTASLQGIPFLARYLQFQAESGVHLVSTSSPRPASGDTGIFLQGPGYYALMVVDLAACALGFAAFCGKTRGPYCEPCGDWLERGTKTRVPFPLVPQALARLQRRDWQGIHELLIPHCQPGAPIHASGANVPTLQIVACSSCDESAMLRFSIPRQNRNGRPTETPWYRVPREGVETIRHGARAADVPDAPITPTATMSSLDRPVTV